MDLYTYYRSSCSYRVRIALNYKEIPYQGIDVNLLKGEQKESIYQKINPQGLVPFLKDQDFGLSQSLAILEYLEECYPRPALLPEGVRDRAMVRALAQVIACDIQPIQNLRVLKYIKTELNASEEQKLAWIRHFISSGFEAYETHLERTAGQYSYGDKVSMADICLVPQIYNAMRFEVPMGSYPIINRIYAALMNLDSFSKAAPENQSQ